MICVPGAFVENSGLVVCSIYGLVVSSDSVVGHNGAFVVESVVFNGMLVVCL